MLNTKTTFSGFSVDDQVTAKEFYNTTLGLKLESENMGLMFQLPSAGKLFIYTKSDHQPATYTVLNFIVDDIDKGVDELTKAGVSMEHYEMGEMKQDEKGIMRPPDPKYGPAIAWFKDPAGNILSIIQA